MFLKFFEKKSEKCCHLIFIVYLCVHYYEMFLYENIVSTIEKLKMNLKKGLYIYIKLQLL
jgi:hypothetical protein